MVSNRLSRWVLELQKYHIDFIHKKGTLNVLPDALSRAVEEIVVTNEYQQDPQYLDLLSKIVEEPENFQDVSIKQGKIFRFFKTRNPKIIDSNTNWKEFVPDSASAIERILTVTFFKLQPPKKI